MHFFADSLIILAEFQPISIFLRTTNSSSAAESTKSGRLVLQILFLIFLSPEVFHNLCNKCVKSANIYYISYVYFI